MTPEIILGSPGCGKTEALLSIVDECLSSGMEPEDIGLVSFTRRAAQEAITRASERFSLEPGRFVHFRTLHSTCFRQLGLAPADVLQGRVLREFADWIGIQITHHRYLEEGMLLGHMEGDRILHMENLARVRCLGLRQLYDQDADGLSWSEVCRVKEGLDMYKRSKHLVDYSEMLSLYAGGQSRPKLRVLLVDEAQDLSLLQWQVVVQLAQGCERVVVAGDDDQAIFVWAGAALEHFVGLPGRVRVLPLSYRVPVAVQALALRCVGRVAHRRPKQWAPRDAQGTVEWVGGIGDAELGGRDILILARNNYILQDQVIPVLRAEGVIYEHRGEVSVDPQVLEAITTWEDLRAGREVTDEDRRHLRRWRRGPLPPAAEMPIWHEGLDKLPSAEMSYLLAARRRGDRLRGRPRVRLSTIHGAKGAQAEHVVLLTEMAPRTAREMERSPDDEARTWYVGLTRAQERLTLVQPGGRHGWEV